MTFGFSRIFLNYLGLAEGSIANAIRAGNILQENPEIKLSLSHETNLSFPACPIVGRRFPRRFETTKSGRLEKSSAEKVSCNLLISLDPEREKNPRKSKTFYNPPKQPWVFRSETGTFQENPNPGSTERRPADHAVEKEPKNRLSSKSCHSGLAHRSPRPPVRQSLFIGARCGNRPLVGPAGADCPKRWGPPSFASPSARRSGGRRFAPPDPAGSALNFDSRLPLRRRARRRTHLGRRFRSRFCGRRPPSALV